MNWERHFTADCANHLVKGLEASTSMNTELVAVSLDSKGQQSGSNRTTHPVNKRFLPTEVPLLDKSLTVSADWDEILASFTYAASETK